MLQNFPLGPLVSWVQVREADPPNRICPAAIKRRAKMGMTLSETLCRENVWFEVSCQ